MRLTDLSIKTLKAPASGAVVYPDDTLTGFGVRVSQAGTKSFALTHGVRRQRETIGRVGIITLKDARSEAQRLLAEYTLGKRKVAATGWNWALERFLEHIQAARKESTYLEYKRTLEKHFRFGETKLADLTPRDLTDKLDKLKATPSEQLHAYVYLRAFLNWAHQQHYVDSKPMERMKSPHSYKPRERVLTDDELRRVWIADCTMSLMRWRTNLFLTSPAFWRGFLLVRGVRFSMVSDHPQVVREGDETHKIRRQTREVASEYLRRVANFYRHHHRVPHRIQKHLTNLIANCQLNAFQVQTLPVPTYAKPFTLTGATGER